MCYNQLVELKQLLARLKMPSEGTNFDKSVTEFEIALISHYLNESHGVISWAAKKLKMNRTTLEAKITKYGLSWNREQAKKAVHRKALVATPPCVGTATPSLDLFRYP